MRKEPNAEPTNHWRQQMLGTVHVLLAHREEELRLLQRLETMLREPLRAPHPSANESHPSAPPAGRPEEIPSWIDDLVDSALDRAFSPGGAGSAEDGEVDDEDADEDDAADDERENGGPNHVAPGLASGATTGRSASPSADNDSMLLVLEDKESQIGFPWAQVREVGLREEECAAAQSYSLRGILGGPPALAGVEPYRVTWETPEGVFALTCARLGGVVPALEAGRQGLEAVLVPSGKEGPFLLSLLDFLARTGARRAAPDPPPVAKAPPATASTIRMAQALREGRDVNAVPVVKPAPAIPGPAVPAPAIPRIRRGAAAGDDSSLVALLAVRYLPARVAIGRWLRFHGWAAQEVVDLPEILIRLRRERFQAVFADPADLPWSRLIPALREARTGGAVVIGVGLRQRRAGMEPLRPLGEIPCLYFPFQDSELERVLGLLPQTRPGS